MFYSYHVVTEHARKKQEETRMQSVWDENLESLRREDKWFRTIKNGTESDIDTLTLLLSKDPNRFYFDYDTRKLINCGKAGQCV